MINGVFRFYFPGLLVGPYLDYQEYSDLINETTFRKLEVRDKAKIGRLIPKGRKRVAYMKMLMGLIYLGIFVVLGGTHNFAVALTPWFASKPLLFRIVAFQVYGTLERTKYYAIWTLTEVW